MGVRQRCTDSKPRRLMRNGSLKHSSAEGDAEEEHALHGWRVEGPAASHPRSPTPRLATGARGSRSPAWRFQQNVCSDFMLPPGTAEKGGEFRSGVLLEPASSGNAQVTQAREKEPLEGSPKGQWWARGATPLAAPHPQRSSPVACSKVLGVFSAWDLST